MMQGPHKGTKIHKINTLLTASITAVATISPICNHNKVEVHIKFDVSRNPSNKKMIQETTINHLHDRALTSTIVITSIPTRAHAPISIATAIVTGQGKEICRFPHVHNITPYTSTSNKSTGEKVKKETSETSFHKQQG